MSTVFEVEFGPPTHKIVQGLRTCRIKGEVSAALVQPQEHRLCTFSSVRDAVGSEPAKFKLCVASNQHLEIKKWKKSRPGITQLLLEPCVVAALPVGAVQGVAGKYMRLSHALCSKWPDANDT